ncbi:hypothetical protein JL107_04385 [Nakamurella flavida]|uniref:NTP pyrophosphohydrolase n=1 Tax=Nakamurella flavida TaxID=363630 RepID=A0A939C1P4_9ACTN|nr:hypothetical protein [Nakamurella flavida]MBM9475680.1 hypothetical protein [Nakamurella flavida]MDP9778043.1 hypothetical protein [Nakamurella flavida]
MVVLVVDVANVMGSRPDGWWRDRPGAATRLLDQLCVLPGRVLEPGVVVGRVVAVLEGASRSARAPAGIDVVLAPADGDSEIVRLAAGLVEPVVVVTADRGLRARLPDGVGVCGPRRLLDVVGG